MSNQIFTNDNAEEKTLTSEPAPDLSVAALRYEPPTVRTYSADELLATLGPAQAGSVNGINVFGS